MRYRLSDIFFNQGDLEDFLNKQATVYRPISVFARGAGLCVLLERRDA